MAIFGDSDGGSERRAYEIAREIVAKELESINRMHSRTMLYISGYVSVIVVGFGLFGWFGYEKLQDIVLHATLEKVQEQTLARVNGQVDQDLRNFDVPGLISRRVGDFASSDLRAALASEVQRGPVHDQIRRLAVEAAAGVRSQASQTSNPAPMVKDTGRSLTDLQRTKFYSAAVARQLLPPPLPAGQAESRDTFVNRNLGIYVVPGNTEAVEYGQQIKAMLSLVGWSADVITGDVAMFADAEHRFATGLHLVHTLIAD